MYVTRCKKKNYKKKIIYSAHFRWLVLSLIVVVIWPQLRSLLYPIMIGK